MLYTVKAHLRGKVKFFIKVNYMFIVTQIHRSHFKLDQKQHAKWVRADGEHVHFSRHKILNITHNIDLNASQTIF